jgi:glycosyltransferase involved in cell wall biosynthesis
MSLKQKQIAIIRQYLTIRKGIVSDSLISAPNVAGAEALKKQSLLIWTQYFWPENFQINEFATALVRHGISTSVLTGMPNYPGGRLYPGYHTFQHAKECHEGINIYRIPIIPRGFKSSLRLFSNYISFVVCGFLFAPWVLRKNKITSVLVYAPSPIIQALPAIFFCWTRRARLVLWVQDLWPEVLTAMGFVKNPIVLKLVDRLVRLIYNHSDIILIQSEGFRSSITQRVNDASKIRYFPNASELNSTSSSKEGLEQYNELLNDLRRNFSVVFAGNIGIAQSCETIVNAAEHIKELSNIRFFIIGDGTEALSLKQMIHSKGLSNVVMVEAIPAQSMSAIYNASSVLLLTLRNHKAFSATIPSKLQSYMIAGKPIVASVNAEGEVARCMLQSRAGIVCSPENPKALAKAVLDIHDMSEKDRLELGLNGKKYSNSHFNLDNRIHELIGMLL